MAIKLFIEDENTVTISCGQCKKSKTVDAARFKGHSRIKVQCTCGHISTFQLEKRRHYRKTTDLKGTYRITDTGGNTPDSGVMTVVDISRNGMRMKFNSFPLLHLGDIMNIAFNLDDANHSLVDRQVVVQNIEAPYIGTKFQHPGSMDNIIGFYLFK